MDDRVFRDPDTDYSINDGSMIEFELQRQIDPEKAAQVEAVAGTASGVATFFTTGNILLNIILGLSLKALWGMINTLQFVVFFTDWNARMPVATEMVIQNFRVIALGEFIPAGFVTDDIKRATLGDDGGDEKSSVLANLGVMILILAVMVIVALLLALIKRFAK